MCSPRVHTFDSLKEPSYRWLWLGMLGSFAGMHMQLLARGWLVVDKLEGSALDLGIVTSGSGASILVFSLIGGVVSDRVPKRVPIGRHSDLQRHNRHAGRSARLYGPCTDMAHDIGCGHVRDRLRLQHARPPEASSPSL